VRVSPAGKDAGGTWHGRRFEARSEHQPTRPATTLSVGLKSAAALSRTQKHRNATATASPATVSDCSPAACSPRTRSPTDSASAPRRSTHGGAPDCSTPTAPTTRTTGSTNRPPPATPDSSNAAAGGTQNEKQSDQPKEVQCDTNSLSYASPREPIETAIPAWCAARPNASDTYCSPASKPQSVPTAHLLPLHARPLPQPGSRRRDVRSPRPRSDGPAPSPDERQRPGPKANPCQCAPFCSQVHSRPGPKRQAPGY
jgi:hypothetical protein